MYIFFLVLLSQTMSFSLNLVRSYWKPACSRFMNQYFDDMNQACQSWKGQVIPNTLWFRLKMCKIVYLLSINFWLEKFNLLMKYPKNALLLKWTFIKKNTFDRKCLSKIKVSTLLKLLVRYLLPKKVLDNTFESNWTNFKLNSHLIL